jgi:hypothetical protein
MRISLLLTGLAMLCGCPPPKVLPSRDRAYEVAEKGEITVWCRPKDAPDRVEKCQLEVEPRDVVLPRELRTAPP